jgi:hypothetical protein
MRTIHIYIALDTYDTLRAKAFLQQQADVTWVGEVGAALEIDQQTDEQQTDPSDFDLKSSPTTSTTFLKVATRRRLRANASYDYATALVYELRDNGIPCDLIAVDPSPSNTNGAHKKKFHEFRHTESGTQRARLARGLVPPPGENDPHCNFLQRRVHSTGTVIRAASREDAQKVHREVVRARNENSETYFLVPIRERGTEGYGQGTEAPPYIAPYLAGCGLLSLTITAAYLADIYLKFGLFNYILVVHILLILMAALYTGALFVDPPAGPSFVSGMMRTIGVGAFRSAPRPFGRLGTSLLLIFMLAASSVLVYFVTLLVVLTVAAPNAAFGLFGSVIAVVLITRGITAWAHSVGVSKSLSWLLPVALTAVGLVAVLVGSGLVLLKLALLNIPLGIVQIGTFEAARESFWFLIAIGIGIAFVLAVAGLGDEFFPTDRSPAGFVWLVSLAVGAVIVLSWFSVVNEATSELVEGRQFNSPLVSFEAVCVLPVGGDVVVLEGELVSLDESVLWWVIHRSADAVLLFREGKWALVARDSVVLRHSNHGSCA